LWLCLLFPPPPPEPAALEQVARWLGHFTPLVSLEPPQALLLEVRGSLKLFGGFTRLRQLLRDGLAARDQAPVMAWAPTARGALWLARAGSPSGALTLAELPRLLARVPIGRLGWPGITVTALRRMGITRLGACLRLPREGFARRFGLACLRELDQALGRCPEVRSCHTGPARFSDRLDLPAETTDTGLLLEGFRILACGLQDCLRARQVALRTVWCGFHHRDGQPTRLPIRLQQASADVTLLLNILRLRLEAIPLPGAIAAIDLAADLVAGFPGTGTDLLGDHLSPDGGLPGLLERLRARLGPRAVHGLALEPEHRPERAWREVADPLAGVAMGQVPARRVCRPLWLLPAPRPLSLHHGLPVLGGALCLKRGPERIETGWWDGADMRRDYYVAEDRQGSCLWIYQDLRRGGWYLHGVF
jgi:protein ImuB